MQEAVKGTKPRRATDLDSLATEYLKWGGAPVVKCLVRLQNLNFVVSVMPIEKQMLALFHSIWVKEKLMQQLKMYWFVHCGLKIEKAIVNEEDWRQ